MLRRQVQTHHRVRRTTSGLLDEDSEFNEGISQQSQSRPPFAWSLGCSRPTTGEWMECSSLMALKGSAEPFEALGIVAFLWRGRGCWDLKPFRVLENDILQEMSDAPCH